MPAQQPASPVTPVSPGPGEMAHSSPAASVQHDPALVIGKAATALEMLGARLTAIGWRASLSAPPGRLPMLDVAHPEVPMLADSITARPGGDGEWWFWWSWAQRIGPVTDTVRAAAMVAAVLGSHGD